MSKLDREGLHRYLWDHTNRAGQIRLNQIALSEQLGISKFTMSRIMAEFLKDGWVRKLATHHGNFRTYAVVDPDQIANQEAKSG